MRKNFFIGILLFLLGIWVAQLIGKEYFATYGYLNSFHRERFVEEDLNLVDLFWNILWTRGKQFFLIWILQMSVCKRVLPLFLKALFVFLLGFFLAVCCMITGANGIWVVFATLFPHGICYFGALLGILDTRRMILPERRQKVKAVIMQSAICILLMMSGAILETVVGTRILRYVLKASKY